MRLMPVTNLNDNRESFSETRRKDAGVFLEHVVTWHRLGIGSEKENDIGYEIPLY